MNQKGIKKVVDYHQDKISSLEIVIQVLKEKIHFNLIVIVTKVKDQIKDSVLIMLQIKSYKLEIKININHIINNKKKLVQTKEILILINKTKEQ
jgi:hypothetical protein